MRFNYPKKRKVNPEEWHFKFLWWPTRINEFTIVWLETVERKRVVDCEGNWAGGYMWHWEYTHCTQITGH